MGSDLLSIGLIIIAGLSVYAFVSTVFGKSGDQVALQWASGAAPIQSKSKLIEWSRPLIHQFTLKYSARIKNPGVRKNIEKKLVKAGMSGELNVDEFIGLQLLWGIMFPVVCLVLNFALQLEYPVVLFIAIAPAGFFFPHMHANSEIQRRYVSVMADLPFFSDLLSLATEAGLDFVGAIQRIVEKSKDSGSVFADELEQVLRDITLGSSRAQALKAMSSRLDIGEVTSFVNVIVDADSTGASIARVLKDQSQQIRLERFVRAEKAGAKASQLILLPLMLFILPAIFIMIFAPVALQFFYGK